MKLLSDYTPQQPTFWELSNFEKAIDVLSRPMYASASAAKALVTGENPFSAAWEGFSGTKRTTYSDVLTAAGMDEGIARSALGFAGDILLDPTTYIGVGAVRSAGSALVRGVPKALTAAGAATRGALVAEKVAQAKRILERLGKGTGKDLVVTKKAMAALMERLPAVDRAAMLKAPAEAVIGRKYGREAFERVLGHETRTQVPEHLRGIARKTTGRIEELVAGAKPKEMLATSAIKLGIPFTKLEVGIAPYSTIGKATKPIRQAYRLAEKIPVAGAGFRGVRKFVESGLGAFKKWFSTRTAWAELNVAKMALRDIEHTRSVRAARYWVEDFGQRLHAIIDRNPDLSKMEREAAKQAVHRELVQMLEGVEAEVKVIADYDVYLRRLDAITEQYKQRIFKTMERLRVITERGTRIEEQVAKLTDEIASLKQRLSQPKMMETPADITMQARIAEKTKQVKSLKDRLKSRFGPEQRGALESEIAGLHEKRGMEEARVVKALTEPTVIKERVKYTPKYPELEPLYQEYREKMHDIIEAERRMINLPPQERMFYFPHILRPEIKSAVIDILRQDARQIIFGEAAPQVQAAMRRTLDKDALAVQIEDYIKSNFFISERVEKAMAERGIAMSPNDLLAFEANPIVAGLKRELSHIHAVTSAEMVRDILSSPTIVKSEVDVADYSRLAKVRRQIERLTKAKGSILAEGQRSHWLALIDKLKQLTDEEAGLVAKLGKYKDILEQHTDHAIYVPNKDYIRIFKTADEVEALRRGGDPELRFGMFRRIEEHEMLAAANLAKKQGLSSIKGYILPREVAETLSRAYALPQMPLVVREFLRKYDATLGWWKAFATAPRPAFHIRNLISNLWQNFMAGLVSPKPYMMAAAIVDPAKRAKMDRIGMYSADEAMEYIENLGVAKSGFIGGDIEGFVTREAQPTPLTPKHGALKGVPGGGLLYPSGALIRKGIKYGTMIEDNARIALFIDGLLHGMDAQTAALRVKKYLFDYTDLTDIEKSIFRRLMPFYTWTRKSIPLALENLITQPGKVGLLGKARVELDKEVEGLDHEYVAEYITKGFGIPFYKNSKGEIEYFLLKGYIPTVDLARLDPQELLSMFSPLIKEPIEQFFNLDFFRMKPIAKYPFEKVEFMGMPMPARAAHLLKNIVILNAIDREVFQRGLEVPRTPFSLLSFRTQSQNPIDQIRRFVMTTQFEVSELRRAAERAREEGRNAVSRSLHARADALAVKRDRAKDRLLQLDPAAFTSRRPRKKKFFSAPPKEFQPQPPRINLQALLRGAP